MNPVIRLNYYADGRNGRLFVARREPTDMGRRRTNLKTSGSCPGVSEWRLNPHLKAAVPVVPH
jgi:hypothetical protein